MRQVWYDRCSLYKLTPSNGRNFQQLFLAEKNVTWLSFIRKQVSKSTATETIAVSFLYLMMALQKWYHQSHFKMTLYFSSQLYIKLEIVHLFLIKKFLRKMHILAKKYLKFKKTFFSVKVAIYEIYKIYLSFFSRKCN